jgi:hypothetical protein
MSGVGSKRGRDASSASPASRDELLSLLSARDAGHAAALAARDATLALRETQHAAALAARDAALSAAGAERDAALAAASAERAAAAAAALERDAALSATRAVLARDATLASALAERDALRRRLALPNVRVALRGEDFLDVIGIVSSVGYAADVSQCAQLCRLTRNIVQRGDVADMLAQSLRLQCGAREARAARREDFLRHAKDVNDDDDEDDVVEGTTQLIRAVILNNLPRVLQLIQLDAPLDLGDEAYGWSALYWASRGGHVHVAKALLDGKYEGHGATVDVRDARGFTPLMFASQAGDEEVVRLLLSRGAKQDLQDYKSRTALHHAVMYNRASVVALLCSAPGATAALAQKATMGVHYLTPLGFALLLVGQGMDRADCIAVLRAHGAQD